MVVTSRRGGGQVGIVSGFTAKGDPIVISGNHGRRVGEGFTHARAYSRMSPREPNYLDAAGRGQFV